MVASLVLASNVWAANAPNVNLQQTMLAKVNPQGLALWDITNAALDDSGNLSAAKITPANWTKLIEIGKALEEGGRILASSSGIIAAAPGAKLQDEGNAGATTAADVQHFLNAKPAVFRSHALELQKTGTAVRCRQETTSQLSNFRLWTQCARTATRSSGIRSKEVPRHSVAG
jgi:hypothetical protein